MDEVILIFIGKLVAYGGISAILAYLMLKYFGKSG
jgi:hypothetical protein